MTEDTTTDTIVYRCTTCNERIHAQVAETGAYSNGFVIGCNCTTVESCPYEMGQAEIPESWVVSRPECCRDKETTDMEPVYGEHADVRCAECGWKYLMTGEFSSRLEQQAQRDQQEQQDTDRGLNEF